MIWVGFARKIYRKQLLYPPKLVGGPADSDMGMQEDMTLVCLEMGDTGHLKLGELAKGKQ